MQKKKERERKETKYEVLQHMNKCHRCNEKESLRYKEIRRVAVVWFHPCEDHKQAKLIYSNGSPARGGWCIDNGVLTKRMHEEKPLSC